MSLGDSGGISDWMALSATRPQGMTAPGGGNAGFASLGDALAGGDQANGQMAYARGMSIGANTADALAQARQRVQDATGAEQAAQFMEDPANAQALGLTPQMGNWAGANMRAGQTPENVAQSLLALQKYNLGSTIANANAPLADRHAAAFAEAPASMTSHAEGPYGSTFDPAAAGGSGQTQVGPLQAKLGDSIIGKNNAAAAATGVDAAARTMSAQAAQANAAAATSRAATAAGAVGNLTGTNPDGSPSTTSPYVNGKPTAQQATYNSRVLMAATTATTELGNVLKLAGGGLPGSTGWIPADTVKGLGGSVEKALGYFGTSAGDQMYNTAMSGYGRALASMEAMGLRGSGQGMSTYNAVINNPATDPVTKAYNLATMQQMLQNGVNVALASPMNRATYDQYHTLQSRLNQMQVFSPQQVIDAAKLAKLPLPSALQHETPAGGADIPMGAPNPTAAPAAAAAQLPVPTGWKAVN